MSKTIDKSSNAIRPKPEVAAQALAEARARQNAIDTKANANAKEIKGRGGLDPVRYGDWEIKGLTSDF
jgi:hypothetical protein